MKYTYIYIYDIAANFLDSCRFYLKKKNNPKNRGQRCWRGDGGGWTSVIEWYYKNASSRTYATT